MGIRITGLICRHCNRTFDRSFDNLHPVTSDGRIVPLESMPRPRHWSYDDMDKIGVRSECDRCMVQGPPKSIFAELKEALLGMFGVNPPTWPKRIKE